MRRIFVTAGFVLIAACTRPQAPGPEPQQPPPSSQHIHGPIIGLTAEELVRLLGTPALQVREGNSLKLQFRHRYCVLDAFLYPPPGAAGPYRVTYVDTRSQSLAPVDRDSCLHAFEGP